MATKSTDFRWIKDGLAARNYLAKDLAKLWELSESSVSRFLSGQEQPDIPLSRAVILAQLLGISLDELARGMGVMGKRVVPAVDTSGPSGPIERAPKLPANSVQLTMLETDKVRITLSQETTPIKAMEVIKILSLN